MEEEHSQMEEEQISFGILKQVDINFEILKEDQTDFM